MTKLFISYRSLDSAKVDALVTRLRTLKNPDNTARYDIWQDKTSIPVGQDWWKAIVQGVIDCDIFVFMISRESVKNPNCRAELSYARKRNRAIIPLVLEDEYTYNTVTGKNDITYWEDVPDELNDGRFQFLFYEGVSFVGQLDQAIELLITLGLRDMPASEPPDPRNANDATNDTGLIYDQACDYAGRMEFATAEKLFHRLTDWRDPYFENEAHEWILILRTYEQLVRFDSRSSTRYRAQGMWDDYAKQFPKPFTPLFDPHDFNSRFTEEIPDTQAELNEQIEESNPDNTPTPTEADTSPAQIKAIESESANTNPPQPIIRESKVVESKPTPPVKQISQPKPKKQKSTYAPSNYGTLEELPEPKPKRNIAFISILVVIGIISILVVIGIISAMLVAGMASGSGNATLPTLSSLDIAKTPVTSNADWTPYEQDFDGVTMVLVPVGRFMMGSDNGGSDEQPVHEQEIVVPFWIDKYEVTQADFVRLGGQNDGGNYSNGDNKPEESLTWFEARDFCESRGGRLPTEKEWEYAARGPDNLTYPWGNEWNENYAVWNGNSNNQTAEVGSRPAGISWVGAMDMSVNVWEWTSSLYTSNYPYSEGQEDESDSTNSRVLRGGSWNSNLAANLRASDRAGFDPTLAYIGGGFRCARS